MPVPAQALERLKGLYPEIQWREAVASAISPWRSPYVHPMFFLVVMPDISRDWIEYEPETLMGILEKRKPEDMQVNMLLAVKACLKSDLAWNNVGAFNNVALSFSGEIPRTDILEYVSPHEVDLALDCMGRIDKRPLAADVEKYIEVIHAFHSKGGERTSPGILLKAKTILPDMENHYSSLGE